MNLLEYGVEWNRTIIRVDHGVVLTEECVFRGQNVSLDCHWFMCLLESRVCEIHAIQMVVYQRRFL